MGHIPPITMVITGGFIYGIVLPTLLPNQNGNKTVLSGERGRFSMLCRLLNAGTLYELPSGKRSHSYGKFHHFIAG